MCGPVPEAHGAPIPAVNPRTKRRKSFKGSFIGGNHKILISSIDPVDKSIPKLPLFSDSSGEGESKQRAKCRGYCCRSNSPEFERKCVNVELCETNDRLTAARDPYFKSVDSTYYTASRGRTKRDACGAPSAFKCCARRTELRRPYRQVLLCSLCNSMKEIHQIFFKFFKIILLLLLTDSSFAITEGLVLSAHIRHFEPVFFERSLLQQQHARVKRDVDHELQLRFHAHNRLFHLRLRRDASVFSPDVEFESSDGAVNFDIHKTYSGYLHDDDQTEVEGLVTSDGLFDGHIRSPNELYYLEPAHRYLKDVEFHSVMYKASDVLDPSSDDCASQKLHDRGGLRYTDDTYRKNNSADNSAAVAASGIHPKLLAAVSARNKKLSLEQQGLEDEGGSNGLQSPEYQEKSLKNARLFIEQHNAPAPSSSAASPGDWVGEEKIKGRSTNRLFPELLKMTPPHNSTRFKRSAVDPSKTTCMLYLQADHLFYERIGSEEACIESITRHVQRVNSIYKVTDFDRDGKPDDIRFMIKRIKIHNQHALSDPAYRFPNNYGVEKFLELFSEEDYDSFCLAYMFTYRDFEGGTLGLAWTGDLKNAGGVCEKNGHYRGSLKSLNTGIVTLLNYGKHVPPAVSHVTLAHEIGHNFGSPHDPEHDTTCTPGGEDGNYIMFARATSGDKLNNNKFSPCSLKKINSVLNSKARDSKGCFTFPQASICGNGVVEAGEECDCGWEEDCDDQCCFPMVTNPRKGHRPCELRPNKICSPSQGPCCTHECLLKEGNKCRDDNGCRDTAFCDGRGPQCPPSVNKPNKTICNKEFVCYRGECTGSICLAYGLESCQCHRSAGDPDTKSCELCCKLPGEDQPCLSSFDWNVYPYNIPDMYAKAGTPCDDYKGYCDVFKKCREVDPSGPLATLRKLLLSDESLASLQEWLQQHWWAVTLLLLAVLVLLLVIVRVFGKQPWGRMRKSSRSARKRKKTVIHKNPTNGIQYPAMSPAASGAVLDSANFVVHPTVVRTNLPFKRRVNEVRRAATKAKRAAKSTLGRPSRKAAKRGESAAGKRSDQSAAKKGDETGGKRAVCVDRRAEASTTQASGGASGATTAVATAAVHANGITTVHATSAAAIPSTSAKPKQKESLSSRFSIINFKSFRPKSLSPDKYKITIIDKRKLKKQIRSKSAGKKPDPRGLSPEKHRREHETKVASMDLVDHAHRNRSPQKRATMDDDRRQNRYRGGAPASRSPNKARRQTLPTADLSRVRGRDKLQVPSVEGNWLIQKFLADEERIAKPYAEGSFGGSVTSMNALINGSCNGSPVMPRIGYGSSRALLHDSVTASPVRGIVNEAFLSSPRGARTHSSLRVTKSVSPDDVDLVFNSNKYRRSISMEAYSQAAVSPDKRKRPKRDEGSSSDKRRRFSSPEKAKELNVVVPRRYEFGESSHFGRNSASPLSSRAGSTQSSGSTHSTSGDRIPREKLSVVTGTTGGSALSIMEPTEILETASLHSAGKSVLDTASLHSSQRAILETPSLRSSSSKILPDTLSLRSNSRDAAISGSPASSANCLPDSMSLHSSGKSLLLDNSSHHSREKIPPDNKKEVIFGASLVESETKNTN
ncbi:uncharacterized protein LOC108671972 [Hyalella azteca]|uniref:ADAM10 endopeptidase n=1 Tax=Hyalella azteca TaxID=294128 RepID=A0A8B7NPM3_HYAAZ|nr:uncharacterized protein LOC108671972 [Hyalella azteca]